MLEETENDELFAYGDLQAVVDDAPVSDIPVDQKKPPGSSCGKRLIYICSCRLLHAPASKRCPEVFQKTSSH